MIIYIYIYIYIYTHSSMGWAGVGWAQLKLGWAFLGWFGLIWLGWAGLCWAGLGGVVLGWAGPGWAGLGSAVWSGSCLRLARHSFFVLFAICCLFAWPRSLCNCALFRHLALALFCFSFWFPTWDVFLFSCISLRCTVLIVSFRTVFDLNTL